MRPLAHEFEPGAVGVGPQRDGTNLCPREGQALSSEIVDDDAIENSVSFGIAVSLDDDFTVLRVDEFGAPQEKCEGVSSDSDVAVDERDHSPGAFRGQIVKNGSEEHRESPFASDGDRSGRHIDAEGKVSGENCSFHDPAGPAADVEERPTQSGEHIDIVFVCRGEKAFNVKPDRSGPRAISRKVLFAGHFLVGCVEEIQPPIPIPQGGIVGGKRSGTEAGRGGEVERWDWHSSTL